MLVDASGDEKITPGDGPDQTNQDKPYQFWLNDDDDQYAPLPAQRADYTTPHVDDVKDLEDCFPVFLDIQRLVEALPPSASVKYKLKQADSAVNFVETNLPCETAFSYRRGALSTGFGTSLGQPASSATTRQITSAGVELSAQFLNNIKDSNKGVILVEGRTPSTNPLVLAVEKDGVQLGEVSLHLSLGARIVLLLHGMNSNTAVWDTFVQEKIGTPVTNWVADIQDKEIKGTARPLMTGNGVRCYRLRFGFYDQNSTRKGLRDVGPIYPRAFVTAANTQGYLGVNGTRCGDFETFDQLGQEVDDAIDALIDPQTNPQYTNARIVLVGHSRGGLAARTFLQTPGTNDRKSAVIGLLTTGSPHRGSPMGRIYNWLDTHQRPLPTGTTDDWHTVDFLKDRDNGIDVRRPVIGDLADNSAAIAALNNSTAVSNLPSSVRYGEIIYKKSDLGRLARTGIGTTAYSVFGSFGVLPELTTPAKTYILGSVSTPSNYPGDGLIPWWLQRFTTLSSFRGIKIPALTDTTNDVLHTEEPGRFQDLQSQLHVLMPTWFP